MAGRVVLIQSSLSIVPAYVMQCAYLPERISSGIDRVNRNFLWGTSNSSRRIHWIGWQKVTKSKKEGGLGFQTAKDQNTALLAKLNWRLHAEQDALWTQVLKRKYCSSRRINSPNPNKLPCSQVWKGIKKGRTTFVKGARWSLGKDSNLNFWSDLWLDLGPLQSVIQGPIEPEIERLRVKDIMIGGSWDWTKKIGRAHV